MHAGFPEKNPAVKLCGGHQYGSKCALKRRNLSSKDRECVKYRGGFNRDQSDRSWTLSN